MSEEPTSELGALLRSYYPVSEQDVRLIADSGRFVFYEKGEPIFAENKYNAFEYFQLNGIAHRHNTDEQDEQVTTGIYSGAVVITPHFARTRNGQSIFSLQALTGCQYFCCPIGAFDGLREKQENIRAFGQKVVESEFSRHLEYEILFRSRQAKERLVYFRDHFPGLENLIPHTIIASYLGITPVSFSRLRNELARK